MKEKNKIGNDNFLDAWKNAFNGIKHTFKTQINIKIQVVIAVFMIILGCVFKLNRIEWIILTLAIFIVVIAEMINTAIEATVDLYTEKYHEKAKIAKDVGAGSVVLAVINSIVVGFLLFFDKIMFFLINK